jgi:dolichyl-phosphate-mannose--protein O-mannosyl transferase
LHYPSGAEYVTCGSTIKLVHEVSRFRLHSHEVNYGTGSGQQSVTAHGSRDDYNSYWLVNKD